MGGKRLSFIFALLHCEIKHHHIIMWYTGQTDHFILEISCSCLPFAVLAVVVRFALELPVFPVKDGGSVYIVHYQAT